MNGKRNGNTIEFCKTKMLWVCKYMWEMIGKKWKERKENDTVLRKKNEKKIVFMFLDAEKAFDNLNGISLFKALEDMDSGGNCIIINYKSIYKLQIAQIIVNGDFTKPCRIQRQARQDSSLSPMLFILIFEILYRDLRQDEWIRGIKIKR